MSVTLKFPNLIKTLPVFNFITAKKKEIKEYNIMLPDLYINETAPNLGI